ncbi:hypothetical protein A3C21_03290 [Candidatus Kaiserbacteria bacterium RIFCSPHIGHO2_02_FULL_59_21]|uniref:Acetyltransferase, N-acetylglutamate synthase n=2 Tax=Candidatus Kaiseribacteriota TaxID=1752734 RepID=A0A0G2B183_9BACT|nr:MAG: Acetyltransferase, N-acetylglutamate synthase [Candidatus Kaiserbacteria bacterium GW2011_GWA2_58_9]OGG62978.1 MAG: hypothetical protein A2766_00300 [Candidatus Kaiserbacteria bacterium RIFCSPHIGHO2_01_FULL_58_22]OGG66684.1 MAG: hypothetical protein A3C21_03290 [Candidatus Kaiserbacteria bacterium RIFCSPHIGHO2_02_FULL_59_21]OGG79073.1 MAG: hypothetical protein A2952_02805 [Candidatus Kaiserbacteria bacterium RIFCSPLOWO2_01_FULL_59_34]OGG84435.1 MAG: hypothetical protein A3I47_02140 [Can
MVRVELARVTTAEDWASYHDIRRTELFEARGRSDYDPNYRGERDPNKTALLLKTNGRAIGTARFDILSPDIAAVRLVAITKKEQGRGFGRLLMKNLESLAKRQGISTLVLNAHPTAVGFYERLGFHKEAWVEPEPGRSDVERVQMTKVLT